MSKRPATELEVRALHYLNDLRSLGSINMFEAPPHVARKLNISSDEAMRLTKLWMHNFSETKDYAHVND